MSTLSNPNSSINFNKQLFATTKSFDNLFFEEKQELIDRLNFFLKNPNFYQKRGIAHSLGLLFYGSPGMFCLFSFRGYICPWIHIRCGKTSTIKAIASYTKRHLVEIPLSCVRTCGELRQAFFLNSYDMTDLDFSHKIIVFEDIDCMSHIIKKRSTSTFVSAEKSDIVTSIEGDNIIFHLEDDDIDLRKKNLSNQTLRSILGDEKTNPNDPLTLSFLLNFFNEENDIDISQLQDYVHSPAEIISACMSSSDGKNTVQFLSEKTLPNVVVEAQKSSIIE
ncbi:hypothetical protein I4U23_004472 [Adineta vaga]|nr:hypothetical protein I4U23_004472 [Adineta vaga]